MPPASYVLPDPNTIQASRSKLVRKLPDQGLGDEQAIAHVEQDIGPALNKSSLSPHYYGFVTGGSTPAATHADNLVTRYDQNVHVHLPNDTIATDVEDAALRLLLDFVNLPEADWKHRTFTTGATASNVLGLACAREWIVSQAAKRNGTTASVSEDGVVEAMEKGKLDSMQILTTLPHSSLRKAASIVGLGRNSIQEFGLYNALHEFDFDALEKALATPDTASIIVISAGEVNTGFFATANDEMQKMRALADKYHAWIHVDAAFGLQARILPADQNEYAVQVQGVKDLELVDSITGDAHKLLNVPYDCGIFLSRHLDIGTSVFKNAGAAYLSISSFDIPSPLNIGIENSRRFRALPVYTTLLSLGRDGYRKILQKQISLARCIAQFIQSEPALELLPRFPPSFRRVKEQWRERIYIIVLFRASNDDVNEELVKRINGTRRIYVSGTMWDGRPAARFAVSNWQVDVEKDLQLIREVLWSVL